MTIEALPGPVRYAGQGDNTIFDIPFVVLHKNNVRVTVYDEAGNTVDFRPEWDYRIDEYTPVADELVVIRKMYRVILTNFLRKGWLLEISQNTPITQDTQFSAYTPDRERLVEEALDKLTIIGQELRWGLDELAAKVPENLAEDMTAAKAHLKILENSLDQVVNGKIREMEKSFTSSLAAMQGKVLQNEISTNASLASLQGKVQQNEIAANAAVTVLQGKIQQNEIAATAAMATLRESLRQNESATNASLAIVREMLEQGGITPDTSLVAIHEKISQNETFMNSTFADVREQIEDNEAFMNSSFASLRDQLGTSETAMNSALAGIRAKVEQNEASLANAMPKAPAGGNYLGQGKTWIAWEEVAGGGQESGALVAIPNYYQRTSPWTCGKEIVNSPDCLHVMLDGRLIIMAKTVLDLTKKANWDNNAYATAVARAGKDFYFYLYAPAAGAETLVLSAEPVRPSGSKFTAANTRKLGGFHCLCADVGVIADHALSGFTAGQILPNSLWDLRHRPMAEPEGMVYCEQLGKWFQIYLTDINGDSKFAATIADRNAGNPASLDGINRGMQYWFTALLGKKKMTLLTDHEFQIVAWGSNLATAIKGPADPVTTGGHIDTAGRRMISNLGLEDCCGAMWQWLLDNAALASSSITDSTNYADTVANAGKFRGAGQILMAGGAWDSGANCGPLARDAYQKRASYMASFGGRGGCPSLPQN